MQLTAHLQRIQASNPSGTLFTLSYERSRFVSVAKVIEITSTSPGSFEDAIRKGISKAQKSIDGVQGAWISEQKVIMAEDGTIKHFRVDMKLTFVLED
jgi:hypothetical protein